MSHPFQCIETIEPPSASDESHRYLLAACGPELLSVCLSNGTILSEWTANSQGAVEDTTGGNGDETRPAKKLKANPTSTRPPNVIKFTISRDNRHAVAVTDDKCVRVFAVEQNGKLEELSQRFMPKRPCAIQILPGNATILCGDKFGDVYSLPLFPDMYHPQEAESAAVDGFNSAGATETVKSESTKFFKPSATNQTVHTQRNRKALEAQLKQQNLTPKTKEPLKFEHKLLLGHVSMLTDLSYTTRDIDGEQPRGYILTADRDEHIRVSRGPTQSHIIEGYCLGHTEFVSKICPIPGTDLLVSGGGDDWLGVWEWPTFKLRRKIDLLSEMKAACKDIDEGVDRIAVSGIWTVQSGEERQVIVVACEKSPILLVFPTGGLLQSNTNHEIPFGSQRFNGPVLDVTPVDSVLLVSLDNRTKDDVRIQARHLGRFWLGEELAEKMDPNNVRPDELGIRFAELNDVEVDMPKEDVLEQLLYGVANLRKRGNVDEIEDTAD